MIKIIWMRNLNEILEMLLHKQKNLKIYKRVCEVCENKVETVE